MTAPTPPPARPERPERIVVWDSALGRYQCKEDEAFAYMNWQESERERLEARVGELEKDRDRLHDKIAGLVLRLVEAGLEPTHTMEQMKADMERLDARTPGTGKEGTSGEGAGL